MVRLTTTKGEFVARAEHQKRLTGGRGGNLAYYSVMLAAFVIKSTKDSAMNVVLLLGKTKPENYTAPIAKFDCNANKCTVCLKSLYQGLFMLDDLLICNFVSENGPNELEFEIHRIDPSILNSIRRVMISEVPYSSDRKGAYGE